MFYLRHCRYGPTNKRLMIIQRQVTRGNCAQGFEEIERYVGSRHLFSRTTTSGEIIHTSGTNENWAPKLTSKRPFLLVRCGPTSNAAASCWENEVFSGKTIMYDELVLMKSCSAILLLSVLLKSPTFSPIPP